MTQRSIALSIVLSIVTCGLYGIYWFIMLTNESNFLSGQQDVSGGVAFLLTLVTCGIYSIYWAYRTGAKLNMAREQRGLQADGNKPVIYLILAIFGLGIVAWALMQDDINQMVV